MMGTILPTANNDLPTIRKLLILGAVEELMDTVSFDDLTVKAICDKAKISRQTFYRHFQSKYDLAPWYWNLIAQQYLSRTGREMTWYEGNYLMMREFRYHQNFFTYFYRTDSHEFGTFRKHSYRQRASFLKDTIAEARGEKTLTPDLVFQIEFFADAEARAVERWVLRGMDTEPDELARVVEKCVPPELHDLIDALHEQFDSAEAQEER